MLKQALLLWLSTRQMPTDVKSIGVFLIWSADEQSWRVRGLAVRKVAEFTDTSAAAVETAMDYLKDHFVIADGEIRNNTINCQLDVLHMARSCGIRLAEAGYRTEFDIVSGFVETLSPRIEAESQTVIPFPRITEQPKGA